MKLIEMIKQRYFYGISVKLFILAKVFISILLFFSLYPRLLEIKILNTRINLMAILSIVFVLILSYSYNRMLALPLIKINQAVAKLANLDFNVNLNLASDDELGELSRNLMVLSDKLSTTIAQLEAELAKNIKLLAQQKDFTDDLSHEIKTPLSIIMAYTEALTDNLNPELQSQYLITINQEAQKLNGLLIELLNLSAMESGRVQLEYQEFDLIELIEEIAGRILIDTANKDFTVQCDFPEKQLLISADRRKLTQAFTNLILNSYQYVSDVGVIKLGVLQQAELVEVNIYNTCPPIPEDRLKHIWQRFYRADESRAKKTGGSGLGLATAAQIFDLHGYEYGAVNEEKGLRFYIIVK